MRSGPPAGAVSRQNTRQKEVGFMDFDIIIEIINILGKAGW